MALDPRLVKVQKLIALATKNPNAEEARSAAEKAIRLMVEHNMTIGLPQPVPPSAPLPPLGYGFAQQSYQNTSLDDLLRRQAYQYAQNAARDAAYDDMWNAAQEQARPSQPSTPEPEETWWDRIRRAVPFVG